MYLSNMYVWSGEEVMVHAQPIVIIYIFSLEDMIKYIWSIHFNLLVCTGKDISYIANGLLFLFSKIHDYLWVRI